MAAVGGAALRIRGESAADTLDTVTPVIRDAVGAAPAARRAGGAP